MRRGNSPSESARIAIQRIINKHPNFFGGVIAVSKDGNYGAACQGMSEFPFSVMNNELQNVTIVSVKCNKN